MLHDMLPPETWGPGPATPSWCSAFGGPCCPSPSLSPVPCLATSTGLHVFRPLFASCKTGHLWCLTCLVLGVSWGAELLRAMPTLWSWVEAALGRRVTRPHHCPNKWSRLLEMLWCSLQPVPRVHTGLGGPWLTAALFLQSLLSTPAGGLWNVPGCSRTGVLSSTSPLGLGPHDISMAEPA